MNKPAATDYERELVLRLGQLAVCDPLTGLHNRGALKELFVGVLENAAARNASIDILYVDLDDFRAVNKLHGQAVGDVIISRVANRLRSHVNEADIIIRMGGDEFLVVSTGAAKPEELECKAHRIATALREPYILESGKTVRISACVGAASFPAPGQDHEEMVAAAELALHHAKKIDDEFVIFNPDLLNAEHKRLVFEHDIALALERGEISVVLQPQEDTDTSTVCGFEALARWHHSELGLISPADFIPAAEASGAIDAIGAFVLAEACKEAAAWPTRLSIAVNVSPAQIISRDFVQVVKDALDETGLEPNRLEVEVTESLFIQDLAYASKILTGVKDLGVSVALDDFGTGYSSLATLRAFPFDRIKIDRSFVCDMLGNSNAAAIVNSILGLGKALGLSVVAEGVETQEQRTFLRALGCQQIQGYLIGKPMPPDHYAAVTGKTAKQKLSKA